jgi:hypothetical protein
MAWQTSARQHTTPYATVKLIQAIGVIQITSKFMKGSICQDRRQQRRCSGHQPEQLD